MVIYNMIKQIVLVSFLIGSLQQCRPQIELPNNLDGMLLYVEDLDGVGGSASGKFSDIVAYDPVNKRQYILTSDKYYDQHPTYSPQTQKIYFESKREKYNPSIGLTAPSHLYELDLTTKKIKLLDDDDFRKTHSFKEWVDLNRPLINNYGDKLLFHFLWGDYKNSYDRLMLYDLTTKTIGSLFDSLNYSFRYVFYENDSSIIFQSSLKNGWKEKTNYIAKLEINTKGVIKFIQEKNFENNLGDVKYNKIVYVSRNFNHSGVISELYIYDIMNDKIRKIAGVEELGFREIKNPVFENENFIYFIGSKESINPDTFEEEVYLLNLNTKEMKQITFTENIKDNLRYYK